AAIKWDGTLESLARRNREVKVSKESFRVSTYRPFFRQRLYLNRELNNSVYQLPGLFPPQGNYGFYANGVHAQTVPAFLMVDSVPCLDMYGKGGQFFPRYWYE